MLSVPGPGTVLVVSRALGTNTSLQSITRPDQITGEVVHPPVYIYVAFLHRDGVSTLTMAPAGVLHTSPLPEHQYEIFLHQSVGGEKEV